MAFAQHINDYDYFLYMEDDLDFQLCHLQYLIETYADLKDTKLLLPGVVRVEHSSENLSERPEENVWLYPEPYFPAQVQNFTVGLRCPVCRLGPDQIRVGSVWQRTCWPCPCYIFRMVQRTEGLPCAS
jgi:hypothetical protein